MLDIAIKILELLCKLFPKLKRPIDAKVNNIRYYLFENRPGDSVVVITSHPSRYQADLRLTNKSVSIIFVEDIILTINNSRTYNSTKPNIRLEPGETTEQTVIFPVDSDNALNRKGKFVLKIVPTLGRKTRIKGKFPTNVETSL